MYKAVVVDGRRGSVGNINAGPGVAVKTTKTTGKHPNNGMDQKSTRGALCVRNTT